MSSKATPEILKVRRVVQLLQAELRALPCSELAVDRSRLDLLRLRLAQLAWATGRAEGISLMEIAGALPAPDVVLDVENARPSGQELIALAERACAIVSDQLTRLGLAPQDRSLDSRSDRLGAVISVLRSMEKEFRERGVEQVYVFGSVARGEDGPDSDVDIAYDLEPDAVERFSLLDSAALTRRLQQQLTVRVDLIERATLRVGASGADYDLSPGVFQLAGV